MEFRLNTQDADLLWQPNLTAGVVHPWHLDQLGHMNVRGYAPFFDDASFLFWHQLQLNQQKMIDEFGVHSVTLRASTEFKAELKRATASQSLAAFKRLAIRASRSNSLWWTRRVKDFSLSMKPSRYSSRRKPDPRSQFRSQYVTGY